MMSEDDQALILLMRVLSDHKQFRGPVSDRNADWFFDAMDDNAGDIENYLSRLSISRIARLKKEVV